MSGSTTYATYLFMPSREADASCVSAKCALRGDRHQWFYIVNIKNCADQTEQYFNEIFCTYVLNLMGYPLNLQYSKKYTALGSYRKKL